MQTILRTSSCAIEASCMSYRTVCFFRSRESFLLTLCLLRRERAQGLIAQISVQSEISQQPNPREYRTDRPTRTVTLQKTIRMPIYWPRSSHGPNRRIPEPWQRISRQRLARVLPAMRNWRNALKSVAAWLP
ncbi:hypothetical protein Bxe_B1757 [Paraburkholderia xenovorans LB400]|uniref:Uncharacterized protein n=1 Tax=Paraburkholderia xenovorans (strain LB400) TaxID=266265 RepID=Q13NY0_PARXL|nr:hypothetical protein Bxe_B1757 [Paraburkholderia xenovorans LB400]